MINDGFSSDLLAGKTIVITGAGRGIGFAVAKAMKGCGAKIIAHSGRSGTAHTLAGITDSVFEADMTDKNSVNKFVEFVQAETSSIDVLINNAGTMLGRFPADELTSDQYQKLVDLN